MDNKKKITLFAVAIVFIIFSVSMSPLNSGMILITPRTSAVHPPIYIDGNSALDAYVSGNGTDGLSLGTAHVIENYEIDCNNNGLGISIRNTDRFLIIRNCSVIEAESTDPTFPDGAINLYNCSNVMVTDCNVHDNYGAGIKAEYSDSLTISDNTIRDNVDVGIVIRRTEDSLISGNTITDAFIGILLDVQCHYTNVTGNTVSTSVYHGIGLYGSDYCNVYGNTISDSIEYGIFIDFGSNDNEVYNNICCNNTEGMVYNANPDANNNLYNNMCPAPPGIPGYPFLGVFGFAFLTAIFLVLKKRKKTKF